MFALVALGMCFVIMTGGIDLSVGVDGGAGERRRRAASALRLVPGLVGGVAPALAVGAAQRADHHAARASCPSSPRWRPCWPQRHRAAARRQPDRSRSPTTPASPTRPGRLPRASRSRPGSRSPPIVLGSVAAQLHRLRPHVLAVGGSEDAARLMGLPVDRVQARSSTCRAARLAGLAGVILAAQFGAGQPTEGVGWELFAIASVVVGGTLLTGGVGLGRRHAGRRAAARPDLQHPQLRERHGLDQPLAPTGSRSSAACFLLLVVMLQSRLTRRPV